MGEAAADEAAAQEYVNQALKETLPGIRLPLMSTLAGSQDVHGAVKVLRCSGCRGKQQARARCTADVTELAMCMGQERHASLSAEVRMTCLRLESLCGASKQKGCAWRSQGTEPTWPPRQAAGLCVLLLEKQSPAGLTALAANRDSHGTLSSTADVASKKLRR